MFGTSIWRTSEMDAQAVLPQRPHIESRREVSRTRSITTSPGSAPPGSDRQTRAITLGSAGTLLEQDQCQANIWLTSVDRLASAGYRLIIFRPDLTPELGRCHLTCNLGSRDRTRTYNLPVNSRTLCRLSYAGLCVLRHAIARAAWPGDHRRGHKGSAP
jgi:hypothetical protein